MPNTFHKYAGRNLARLLLGVILMGSPGITGQYLYGDDEAPNTLPPLPKSPDYYITFGYWNDNIFFQEHLAEFLPKGGDDFYTANLWLQAGMYVAKRWWIADQYYHVTTNRKRNHRFDILATRISTRLARPWGMLKFGVGAVSRGNYGGGQLQNWYHAAFRHTPVQIPYTLDNASGWAGFLEFRVPVLDFATVQYSLYSSGAYYTAVIPSKLEAGVVLSKPFMGPLEGSRFQIQTHLGYRIYANTGTLNEPLYAQGFLGTLYLSFSIPRLTVTTWYSVNRYGHGNPHYGVAFSRGAFSLPSGFSN